MSARGAMQQRMTVQRDSTVVSPDDYAETREWETVLDEVPCRYWIRSRLEMQSSQSVNVAAVVADARIICPVVDIRETDRILNVKDRAGNVQVGAMSIQGIERRFEAGGHLELFVRAVS